MKTYLRVPFFFFLKNKTNGLSNITEVAIAVKMLELKIHVVYGFQVH